MPSFCAVLDCNDKYGQNVPFHKFPTKNKELLEKWIEFTQRPKDWVPSKWTSVCGLHFRDEDYRCSEQKKLLKKNAVPTVRTTHYSNSARNTSSNANKSFNSTESEGELSNNDMDDSNNKIQKCSSNCRFCGFTTSNFVSFVGNFEIFGVIQKCLPALSIRQDDNMPKEICRRCLRRLENFSIFIDKVLETQTSFQCQFRNEKGGHLKPNERAIKIKQEPVVRVKQENIDDVNVFFPDEVDDGCGEQEHDVSNTETQMDQKFQFCDFPVLNDQDIINNCDIMEIINLSDPFIDITNCENTIAEEDESHNRQQPLDDNPSKQIQMLPSAHELLQSHFLNEEHNYAMLTEDFKEEWPMRHSYKTEKIEADEFEANHSVESTWIEDIVQDIIINFPEDYADVAATMTVGTTMSEDECTPRSSKPIVTSVSSLHEANMLPVMPATSFPNTQECCNAATSRKKPNIVVLNESIVQSSHAFQFEACTICQSKFFSIDSLNHHYAVSHDLQVTTSNAATTQPMVMVPSSNIPIWDEETNRTSQPECRSYKTEKDICAEVIQTPNLPLDNSKATALTKRSSKNEIKILDMQQTFSKHQYNYTNQFHLEQLPAFPQANEQFSNEATKNLESHNNPIDANAKRKSSMNFESQSVAPFYFNHSMTDKKTETVYETISVETPYSKNENLETISNKYMELQKRYRRLQQKCLTLVQNKTAKKHQHQHSLKNTFRCRMCAAEFTSIFQLLRHKQSTPFHHVRKSNAHFCASCAGCEKTFFRKIALYNHMRYICPFLPLRWLKNQIRTFKCRYCRRITFTHWRLCRKHELKCRYHRRKPRTECKNIEEKKLPFRSKKMLNNSSKNRISKSKTLHSESSNRAHKSFECDQCKKVFQSLSCLNQHHITHTSARVHQCEICRRVFKRRNGLTQHVRGFHMKLKPYECPICKHRYALRGDMTRCKHSALSRTTSGGGASGKKIVQHPR